MRKILLLGIVLCWVGAVWASPPSAVFSPPQGNAVPRLHQTSPTAQPAHAQPATGWETLRRDAAPQPLESPATQGWRWILGLLVALALIRWGLPRAIQGGKGGQLAHWLTRITPPSSEGAITVLDTRFLGACSVHLISVRGRTLLLGCTAQQVHLLMDLTQSGEEPSRFEQVLSQSQPYTPPTALQQEAEDTQEVLQEVQQRLRHATRRLG